MPTRIPSTNSKKHDDDDPGQIDQPSMPARRESDTKVEDEGAAAATTTKTASLKKPPPQIPSTTSKPTTTTAQRISSGAPRVASIAATAATMEKEAKYAGAVRVREVPNVKAYSNGNKKKDTMEAEKEKELALRHADAVADPRVRSQEGMGNTVGAERQLRHATLRAPDVIQGEQSVQNNTIDPMIAEKNAARQLRYAAAAPPPPDDGEGQRPTVASLTRPGVVHVSNRFSDASMDSTTREQMEQFNGVRMEDKPDDNEQVDPEACIVAHLVPDSDDGSEDEEVVVAEPVLKQRTVCGISRKLLIVIALIILIAGNVTLGVVFSRKKPDKKDPIISSPGDDDLLPTLNLDPILQTVKDRGFIRCKPDALDLSENKGFTLDLCYAIAAAIFDDAIEDNANRTELIDLPFGEQFKALADGSIDVTTAFTTHNMVREVYEPSTGLGVAFSTPYFYSGMRFVGKPTFVECAERGDSLIGECRSLTICVKQGSTHASTIEDKLPGVISGKGDENLDLFQMLSSGTCNVIAGDIVNLREQELRSIGYEGEYTVGTKLHTNEPLTIASKGSDKEWADFCNWILRALIAAEANGITQEIALSSELWSNATAGTSFPDMISVFGDEHKNIFRNAIAAVGNYGELYERHFEHVAARDTAGVENTINHGDSGVLYAFPFGNLLVDAALSPADIPPVGPFVNGTLDAIAGRGLLRCGISGNRPGFALLEGSEDNLTMAWTGLDVEYCRAIAASLFPQTAGIDVEQDSNIMYIDIGSDIQDGYIALDDDAIDVLVGGIITLTTDVNETLTGNGYTFTPPYFYYDTNEDEFISSSLNISIGENIGLSLVTRQDDQQWSTFVRWITTAFVYAEDNDISGLFALEMPVVELFGPNYLQMLRDAVLAAGNYGELFHRTLEVPYNITRTGRNLIASGGEPLLVPTLFI